MTLVELLVVMAILGLLAVTVLPALGTGAERGRTKAVAAGVSTMIAQAHARGLGRKEWSGVMFVSSPSNPLAAVDLVSVRVPPPYCGDSVNAKIALQSGSLPIRVALPESACPTINISPSSSPIELLSVGTSGSGDLIQFDGSGPFYELVTAATGSLTFQMRGSGTTSNSGQNALNTPWPAETPTAHTFEIFRQPISTGDRFSLPDGRAIDMSWSGYVTGTGTGYGLFTGAPAPVSILFDGTGRLRQIIENGIRKLPAGPVYLLVGRADRAGQAKATLNPDDDSLGANWQYADSVWLSIDPQTGVVRSAGCKPNASDEYDSQSYVRN